MIDLVVVTSLPFTPPSTFTKYLELINSRAYSNAIVRKLLHELPIQMKVVQAFGRSFRSPRETSRLIFLDARASMLENVFTIRKFRRLDDLLDALKAFNLEYESRENVTGVS